MHTVKNHKVVLVVEDERPLAEAIRAKLETEGFEVATSRTVEQALNYLQELSHVDAIWLDHYLLGKEDGLDFVAKLKSVGGAWNHIPVFVVSNTAGTEKIQSYINFGIEKYYIKAEHKLEDIINDIKSVLKKEE
jgi:CheY-like chemotaxis protein